MQINLPVEPAIPAPASEKIAPSSSKQEAGSSFEDFLGSGKQAATPKSAAAESAAKAPEPAESKDNLAVPERPEAEAKQVDPTVAATLAALAINFPIPLPPPPTVTVAAELTIDPSTLPPVPTPADADSAVTPAPVTVPEDAQAITTAEAGVVATPVTPAKPALTAQTTASTAPTVSVEAAVAAAPVVTPEETQEKPKDEAKSGPEPKAEAPEPTISTALSVPREKRGTAAAMDRGTMSNALLSRQVKAKATGLVASDKAPVFANLPRAAVVPHATATKQPAAPVSEPATSMDAQPVLTNSSPATSSATPTSSAPTTEATARAERIVQDASVTLGHVERMTEHLQVTGRRQMEVEVKLQDDSKITISIQMQRGELRTTFKTDSAGLRDALSQNWGQVTEKNADRSIRLTPPVFETSEGRNGFSGDARQQPRDGRTFTQPETEGQPFQIRLPAKPVAPAAAVAPSQSGLALYA